MISERFYTKTKWFSTIEVILSIAIFSMFIAIILGLYYYSSYSTKLSADKNREILYAQEGIEAVNNIRDRDFNALVNGTHGLTINSFLWELNGSSDTYGNLTREVTISDVDSFTKEIQVVVTNTVSSKTVTLKTQMSSWKTETWLVTSQAEFDSGTLTNVVSTDNSGWELELADGANADWCNPSLTLNEYDISGSGVMQEISVEEWQIAVATWWNASSPTFVQYDVTSDDPPTATYVDEYDSWKWNDIFILDDYGYIATDTNSEEVVILDYSSSPFTKVGWFDTPWTSNAVSVYAQGDTWYVTVGDTLYTYDITSKTWSRSQEDSLVLYGDIAEIQVQWDYLYAALDNSTRQLEIIDVSDPTDILNVWYLEISAGKWVDVDLSSDGNELYLATDYSSWADEFHIVDVTSKTGSKSVTGSHSSWLMDPSSLELTTSNRVVMWGIWGEHYQVYDISTPSSPLQCGGLLIADIMEMWSITWFGGNAYSYVLTDEPTAELKIVLGWPGGGTSYSLSGEYESEVYDTTQDSDFYIISWDSDVPANTTLSFQARSWDSVDLSWESWEWPDGTSGTYFTDVDLWTLGSNFTTDRYVQYKAFFTTDWVDTPTLYETRIHYK